MSVTILCKHSSHHKFSKYSEIPNIDPRLPSPDPVEIASVKIAGQANIPSLTNGGYGEMTKGNMGSPMWTPSAVATTITDEAWEWLQHDVKFKKFVDMGIMSVVERNPGNNHDLTKRLSEGMAERDGLAPLVPGDVRLKKLGLVGQDNPNMNISVSTGVEGI